MRKQTKSGDYYLIQIQHLLKLNPTTTTESENDFYSNTTLVKVKFQSLVWLIYNLSYSNTTLVKVKFIYHYLPWYNKLHSNTTLVKVKWSVPLDRNFGIDIQIQHLLKLNATIFFNFDICSVIQIQHLLKLNNSFSRCGFIFYSIQIQHLLKLNAFSEVLPPA